MTGVLRVPRRAALAAIAVLVAAASLTSFAESYRGLWLWAQHHGLHGVWAVAWPLQIDTFIGVGELALFVALADSWPSRSRAAAWTVTVLGLAVSVAGNVGHIAGHDLASRATAAVPPLAAAAALAVGLGVLKRVVAATDPLSRPTSTPVAGHGSGSDAVHPLALGNGHTAPEGAHDAAQRFASELAAGHVPSVREIRRRMHVGQPRAQALRSYLTALAPSGAPAAEPTGAPGDGGHAHR